MKSEIQRPIAANLRAGGESPAESVAGAWLGVPTVGLALVVSLLAGCAAPIGADRVTTRQAYAQVDANALRSGSPSPDTVSVLHRYGLDKLAARHPDEAVKQLHAHAAASGERDLLFALAETSYLAAKQISRSVKPWDPRDARDYYLGSAVYAWLFLFGRANEAPPDGFDRRFREACDLYNYSLGLALTGWRSTNAVVHLQTERRRLPVGEIELRVLGGDVASRLDTFEKVLLADQFRVRGLSVRNRVPGIGTPLICVGPLNREADLRPSSPATAFLRGPTSLNEIEAGARAFPLELYSGFNSATVSIGERTVPLELDLTTYRAYTLNQATIWKLGPLQFLAPEERIRSRLILNQPFDPNRIPVVFVHGTFSSPVTWAEMANTLTADPVLRENYQLWSFMYGSGNPLVQSVAEFRAALTAEVHRLDPKGTNTALRQMVVIGHSQGGLLTKATVVDVGDRLWRIVSTNRFEDIKVSESERERLQEYFFYKPLPFVRCVVFIATPHRGSFLSGGFVRQLARWCVSLPSTLLTQTRSLMQVSAGSEANKFTGGRLPTSLDGMSPKNPGLLAMADIPVARWITAHSIVAIDGDEQPPAGDDGVVKYTSAHVDYANSEFIVRSFHSCLNQPATIGEVRRILHACLRGAVSNTLPLSATRDRERHHQSSNTEAAAASKRNP